MKYYIKQNKILFIITILVSVITSLGYVFMAILIKVKIRLPKLLQISGYTLH